MFERLFEAYVFDTIQLDEHSILSPAFLGQLLTQTLFDPVKSIEGSTTYKLG